MDTRHGNNFLKETAQEGHVEAAALLYEIEALLKDCFTGHIHADNALEYVLPNGQKFRLSLTETTAQ